MFKEIARTYLVKYITTILTFLSGILIARFFGPEGKGEISSYLFIPQAIILYSEFGVSESIMQFTSKKRNINTFFLIKHILFSIFFAMILYCVYVFFFNDSFLQISFLGPLLILLVFFNQLLVFYLKGRSKFKIFNYDSLIKSLFIFTSVLLVCFFDFSILVLLKLYLASYILSILFVFYFGCRKREVFSEDVKNKVFLNFSFKTYFYKVLNSTESIFDKLLIVTILSLSDFGLYSVVVALSSILYVVFVNPISSILLPILNNNTIESRVILVNLFCRIIILFVSIVGVLMIFFGESLILLFYGEKFISASLTFKILLVGVIFKSPMAILSHYFKSINQPEKLVKISLITLPINIIGSFLLIPKLGILGAGIISSLTYSIFAFLLLQKYIYYSKSNLKDIFLFKKEDILFIKKNVKLFE